jgi:hypothetical protein
MAALPPPKIVQSTFIEPAVASSVELHSQDVEVVGAAIQAPTSSGTAKVADAPTVAAPVIAQAVALAPVVVGGEEV